MAKDNKTIVPEEETLAKDGVLTNSRAEGIEGLVKETSRFTAGEKNALEYPDKSC